MNKSIELTYEYVESAIETYGELVVFECIKDGDFKVVITDKEERTNYCNWLIKMRSYENTL